MKLLHYSDQPLLMVASAPPQKINMKPTGLWVSVDDDWKEWCESEDFHVECLKYVHRVILTKKANILHLSSTEAIFKFTEKYREKLIPEGSQHPGISKRINGGYINWPAVANAYQGIIIAPYNYDCRWHEDTLWYYGWDCASGCIWDHEAVYSIKKL